ncbi:MAG: hypothetical protein J7559_08030, partial [Cohnella sp.]|nr:hypothetical protein [Cohnella sp.]
MLAVRNRKIRARLALIAVCILFAALAGFAFSQADVASRQDKPAAKHGQLDARQWNFSEDGNLKLNGEWAFYQGQLLASKDFATDSAPRPSGFFAAPDVWTEYRVDGQRMKGHGYATYRLIVRTDGAQEDLALHIPAMAPSYKVIVAGKTVAEGGAVGPDEAHSRAAYRPAIVSFKAPADEFDIIVQLSNYLFARGGMWFGLELGSVERIYEAREGKLAVDMIFFGSAIMLGCYHLLVFALRRADRSSL